MGRRRRQLPTAVVFVDGMPTMTGDFLFLMHDTYGFPLELTAEMAAERGLAADLDGFYRLMREQQERSRAAHRAKRAATPSPT